MKNMNQDIPGSLSQPKKRHTFLKVGGIVLCILISITVIIAASLAGITRWLTPERVAAIISKESAKYLRADISTAPVDYTIWSSFPSLSIRCDSVRIVSHSLDGSILASTHEVRASLNILKALKGEIELEDVHIVSPYVNIVSVNDTLNNYSILKDDRTKPHLKRVSTGKIKIDGPAVVRYTDMSTPSEVRLSVDEAVITPPSGNDGEFDIQMRARVTGHYKKVSLPFPLPLTLTGKLDLSSNPFRLSTKSFKIAAGHTEAVVTADISGNNPVTIASLTAEIESPDILEFVPLLPPEEQSPIKEALKTIRNPSLVPMNLYASLLSPYTATSREIPALEAIVKIPDVSFSIPISPKKEISVRDLSLNAGFTCDKGDSNGGRLTINECSFKASDGIVCSVSGCLDSLLGKTPSLKADIKAKGNMGQIEQGFLPSSSMRADGDIVAKSHIEGTLSDINGAFSPKRIKIRGEVKSPLLTINDTSCNLSSRLSRFYLSYAAEGKASGAASKGDLHINAGNITASYGKTSMSADSVSLLIGAKLRGTPFSPSSCHAAYSSEKDSILSAEVSHTPLYVTPALPSMLQTVLSLADISADLSLKDGILNTPAYPAANSFSNVHISSTSDSLKIRSMNLESGPTSAALKGEISNLRGFLLGSAGSPLKVSLDADLSDVDINRLCGAYFKGKEALSGIPCSYKVSPEGDMNAGDTVCVAIPRNITADIRLRSDHAEYLQHRFSPLSACISMRDGVASINSLTIGAPYCSARLDWTYATADLDDIYMTLDADIDGFDMREFLTHFPQLSEGMPQLEDISGKIDVKADGKFLMFPNMLVNAPSMTAEAKLTGDSIMVERDDSEIRHASHMMLIRGDNPIAVNGLDIHASFHDNLLLVEPFTLDFGGYRVLMAGVNNLQGEIYYHAGLLASPFHLPFGINIVGNYRHPSVRFGGRWVNDGRERDIASNLEDDVNINIMRELRHGWLVFVNAAAKYDAENNQNSISSVN